MFDENGNVNGNGTASAASNDSNADSPSAIAISASAAATSTNVAATSAAAATQLRSRPIALSPVSTGDIPPSFAYLNLNAQNGYVPQNGGQIMNQQLNRMALISHVMNVKDPTWLQVEVCREYQRGQCSRNEQECKFAHPLPHVEVQNGRVIACYDSLKVSSWLQACSHLVTFPVFSESLHQRHVRLQIPTSTATFERASFE